MGKLTNMKPRLGTLSPRLGYAPNDEKARDQRRVGHEPWRRWYRIARWQKLRQAVFLRDLYTCQMPGCGRLEGNTSLLVCDHIKPHKGDQRLFWDETNLQTTCKPCHNGVKQRMEKGRPGGG
jgi:5-methylcytosine-specific restriction endonuclease McrA